MRISLILKDKRLKVASMFAGCGGMDFAFHKQPHKFEMIYANDHDRDSCETYENYYGHKPVCENICKIQTIPACDILMGGFPLSGIFNSQYS